MADLNVASRAGTTVLMDASARYGRLLQDPSLEIELARIVEEGQRRGEIRADVGREQAGQLPAACCFTTTLRRIPSGAGPLRPPPATRRRARHHPAGLLGGEAV